MSNIIAKNYCLKYFYKYHLFSFFKCQNDMFLLSMYQKYVAKSHIHDEKDDMDVIFGFLSFF